jgi:predicted DNA-binding ribbon-helix-helix protein
MPGDPDSAARARIRKHSVTIAGHSTSLSLEEAFWDALKDCARREGCSVNALVERIDRGRAGNLSSAVRVYLLEQASGHSGH